MNRCHITQRFTRDLIQGLKTKPRNRKVRLFLEKWKLYLKQGKLYHGDRLVVPYEETEDLLKREAEQNGMPLSRDGAFHYLKKKYVGFKKRQINTWLKSIEQLQLIHKRPFKENRSNLNNREGTKNYFMKNNKLNLGVDLFAMPKPEWASYSFFFVAVLQRSGYTWAIPMKNKEAKTALSKLKTVWAECTKMFGAPTGVTTDDGSEFKAQFDAWLARKRIKRRIVTGRKGRGQMTWWVEKKNSTFARIFAVMITLHGFKKALRLSLEKVNNIRSRINRKAPVDWTREDFQKSTKRYNRKIPKRAKQRKQPRFYEDDRVRYMLKAAEDKSKFYKSYEGMRGKKFEMWTQRIYIVTDVKKLGHGLMYKVNGVWKYPFELQLIEGNVIRLESGGPPPVLKEVPQPKRPAKKRVPKPKRSLRPVAVPLGLRRSTRIRHKPKRYGF